MENPLRIPDDPDFRLIETALWTPEGGLNNAELHVDRMTRTAQMFGIPTPDLSALAQVTADGPRRLRLTVDRTGQADVALHAFNPLAPETVWRVALSPDRLSSTDPWLRVKTTERALYDTARARLPDRADELIFLNEHDQICEGTITNVFVDLGQGLLTPPVTCGLLPGILRRRLLEEGRARETVLSYQDLLSANAIYVGNSLRGLIRAHLTPEP